MDNREQALQRLIRRIVPQDKVPSTIETIFSDGKVTDMIDRLRDSDAQAFIDVIDEVRRHSLQLWGIS